MSVFRDRADAGRALAARLAKYKSNHVIILALPRGGVPVGFEVARELDAPLDIFLVRKLGVPWHPELAMGAIAAGGVRVLNQEVVEMFRISPKSIEEAARREERVLEQQEKLYRPNMPKPEIEGKIAILVDDGLATGSTMMAATEALRRLQPAKVVVAVPVAPASTCEELLGRADEVVCAHQPWPFHSVSLWYENFDQTSDSEVRDLLELAATSRRHS